MVLSLFRTVKVRDKSIPDPATARPRADKTRLQEVYALNGGDVIEVKVRALFGCFMGCRIPNIYVLCLLLTILTG